MIRLWGDSLRLGFKTLSEVTDAKQLRSWRSGQSTLRPHNGRLRLYSLFLYARSRPILVGAFILVRYILTGSQIGSRMPIFPTTPTRVRFYDAKHHSPGIA